MAINTKTIKEGLKTTGKVVGLGAVGGTVGAGAGVLEGANYNRGGTIATGFRPVKDKDKRKRNLKRFATAYGILGGLGLPGVYLLGKYGKGKYGEKGGFGGEEWEENFRRRYSQSGSGYNRGYTPPKKNINHFEDVFKTHGVNLKDIKTKEQFSKMYRGIQKKMHPDVNKSTNATEMASKINGAVSDIKKTDWYEKLAFLLMSLGIEKTAKEKEIVSMDNKKAYYVEGIEKMAEEKKTSLRQKLKKHNVATMAGTTLAMSGGSIGVNALKKAKAEGKARALKEHFIGGTKKPGIIKGLKTMAEKAGGKGKLLKNLAKEHGKTNLIVGGAFTGLAAGANALRNRKVKKTADYIKGIEKIAKEKRKTNPVIAGAATGVGSLAVDTLANAHGVAKGAGLKGIKGTGTAFKAMSEISGGKGKLAKNIIKQHGKSALAMSGIGAGLAMAGNALKNKRTEKTAEEKKRNNPVVVGALTGAGSAAYDIGKGAHTTAKAEKLKGMGKGLKSMAEKAGGSGKLMKNLLKQHGPMALASGAAATGLVAGSNALKNRRAEKVASERQDDPNNRIPRNRYKEYDTAKEVLKRGGKYMGVGTALGSGAGAILGGKFGHSRSAGALLGGLFGLSGGAASSSIHQAIRDSKSANKRYAGDKKAGRIGSAFGPAIGDRYIAARDQKVADYMEGIEKIAFSGFNKKKKLKRYLASVDDRMPMAVQG